MLPSRPHAFVLTPIEARIVGALIEKALTTPEYYPLTLNALLAACNQRNNRSPVMALDERTVQQGLYGLQEKRLAECFSGATARVVKYRERLIAELELDPAERALICELLLRGPQTPGELRSRASRMHPFASLDEVATTLQRPQRAKTARSSPNFRASPATRRRASPTCWATSRPLWKSPM